ncbi:MAG: hypothetical protein NVS9B4_24050 [Candidatus Acidiferrum sp.]
MIKFPAKLIGIELHDRELGLGRMGHIKKNLHKMFARFSPPFAGFKTSLRFLAIFCCVLACTAIARSAGADPTASMRRQSASAQFERAQEQRALLNSKPSAKRTLADYRQVLASYRRVSLITFRAPEVPDSLLAIAELFAEMGERFGRSYYQSSVDSYLYLVHEYPTSKYCQNALLQTARIQKDQLGAASQAAATYQDFLKRYPRSTHKPEVMEALADLALLNNSEPAAPAKDSANAAGKTLAANDEDQIPAQEPQPVSSVSSPPVFSKNGGRSGAGEVPRVRRIRASAEGDVTRVTIDLEDTVQYGSARITNPDRIFFDLHAARLAPEVAKSAVRVQGDLLTAVRAAQNHNGVVRVVLDVNGVKDYSATLSQDPPRLLIELYGSAEAERTAKSKRTQELAMHQALQTAPPVPVIPAKKRAVPQPVPMQQSASNAERAAQEAAADLSLDTAAATPPPPAPKEPPVRTVTAKLKSHGGGSERDLIRAASVPRPTRDGQSTLTRALGLKIGRIVIDAGHGGHDTGTIGPTGLMEKDLCLDIALRLNKIIQQRLPGASVVLTRSDDTFVPLEERTNIANDARADLFISIHANSSRDHDARGIETYYLNLKGTPEAMEVAARENAVSQEGIHDLEDLVKKIARNEKIDESKEFAQDVQNSLSQRVRKSNKTVRNRGVRKAPFMVLIGAGMPSILTEISFLSNPADEQLLKDPDQRQHIAEGLYQGVASYLQNMNSMTSNMTARPSPSARRTPVALVEQSRNEQ